MTPLRICFLILDLGAGGAQRQLSELVRRLEKTRFEPTVLTFYPGGLLWREIEQSPGVRLVCLDKAGRWDVPCTTLGRRRRRKPNRRIPNRTVAHDVSAILRDRSDDYPSVSWHLPTA